MSDLTSGRAAPVRPSRVSRAPRSLWGLSLGALVCVLGCGDNGGSANGGGSGGAGGSMLCVPGTMQSCYSGPPATKGVGVCVGGTQVCNAAGQGFGPCAGEVLPKVERCGTALDEDCNGATDEAGCTPLGVLQIANRAAFTCALLGDGGLKCWGDNGAGQLGRGDTQQRGDAPDQMGDKLPRIALGATAPIDSIAVGSTHVCALFQDARIKCWGGAQVGQLGLGDTSSRGDAPGEMGDDLPYVDLGGPLPKALATGHLHTCALLSDGRIKCWGSNGFGELGLGDKVVRGKDASEMGAHLPFVDLGAGVVAKALAGGYLHTCALSEGGRVKCWGSNAHGQLGLGDKVSRGDNGGEMGDNLPYVDLGTGRTASAIAAGGNTTCAILDDGNVKCWGLNVFGQLGLGDTEHRGDAPGEMGDNLQSVALGTGRKAKRISVGWSHVCAILDDDRMKCWGYAHTGELGLGDTNARGDQPGEMGDDLPAVDVGTGKHARAAAAGTDFTCALLDDDRVKCWGDGPIGKLGLGDDITRGDAAGEMGDNLPYVKLFSATF